MKRIVVFLTVWAMALVGVLASVVIPAGSASATSTTAGGFVSVAPARLLDTRTGLGVAGVKAAVKAGATVHLKVTGTGGVPLSGVAAVVLNVTATAPTTPGFVTVYSTGHLLPGVSNLNFVKGQTVPNLVIVPLGSGGKVDLYNGSTGTVGLLADVTGYYLSGAATKAGSYESMDSARLLDTRTGLGAAKTAVKALGIVHLKVTDPNGAPAAKGSAVVLNVTATAPTSTGYVTVYAEGTPRPTASNVNFVKGQTVPNLVIAPVGTGGMVDLYNGSPGTVQLLADVSGYYATGAPTVEGMYGSVAPARLLDTRSGVGAAKAAVKANQSVKLKVTGPTGIPASEGSTVALNVTATESTSAGFVTVSADGKPLPGVSNLNYVKGQTVPNLVIAEVGSGGMVDLFNGSTGTVQLLADVSGYHRGTIVTPATAGLSINGSTGATAMTSLDATAASHFDMTGSLAGSGSTLNSASLNYGDGTIMSFVGNQAAWSSDHAYTTAGDKAVTLWVADSAGNTATAAVTLTVYPKPTAKVTAKSVIARPGEPVTFDLAASTPVGTVITDYDVCYDGTNGPIWVRVNGLPPATVQHTFATAGTYDVEFYVYNNADGWTLSTIQVVVDATPPGSVSPLTAAAGFDSIKLGWTNPTDADFAGVMIRRIVGATAPATVNDGTLVTDTAKAAVTFTDTGLASSTEYAYAAFAHDGSGNYAAPVDITRTTAAGPPIAKLSITAGAAATAKTSVGGYTSGFDLSGSQAGSGETLVSATLDYGDGTSKSFTGDPAGWLSDHAYTTVGDKTVTVVVTNSAGDTATAVSTVSVYAMPTATIKAVLPTNAGFAVTFDLTSMTPVGTMITDYEVNYGDGTPTEYGTGTPPATVTHTFATAGPYTVAFDTFNDADGWGLASTKVTAIDVTPTGPVTNAQVSVVSIADNFLSLSWVNPTDADFKGVIIRRSVGAVAPATVNDGVPVSDIASPDAYIVDAGLTAGTQYSYAFFAYDAAGNFAAGAHATGTTTGTAPHAFPPGPVTALTATALAGDTSIRLDWVNPTDLDFAGVTVRRMAGATAPATVTDGDQVVVPVSATAKSFTDTGLTAGTEYSYAVFAQDAAGLIGAAANVTTATTRSTTAELLVDTTRITVGGEFFCDLSPSYAATGATLTGTLDYGDGTPLETFSGAPVGWYAFHTYAATGAKAMTWTVTDSTNKSVTKVVTMNVFDPPTASMPATATATVGVPFTFPLTATTPVGTAWQSWNLYGDVLDGGFGIAAPASTHTFMVAGTYTFTLTVTNDAQGSVESSPMVVTVQ